MEAHARLLEIADIDHHEIAALRHGVLEADAIQPVEEHLTLAGIQLGQPVVIALREVQADDRRLLKRRRRADGQEVMHLFRALDHVFRPDEVAEAPAGDRVRLGKGGAADHAVGDLRQRTRIYMMIWREDDVLVYLVGNHVCVVPVAQAADEQQLVLGEDLAARVRRVADDDCLWVLAECVFQHVAVKVVRRGDERHEDRVCAGENRVRAVVFIEGGEHDHLVAGVADGHHGAHHGLRAAAGDENLGIRVDFAAICAPLLAGERLAEVLRAEGHGILMRAFVRHLAQTVGDRLGRRKIRETLGKIDGIHFVADAGHAADDGIGKRLNAAAQLWHKYSHLSI